MKAITVYQPWASLIAWGEKRYETRTWAARHRGLLAIHAAAPKTAVWLRLTCAHPIWGILKRRGVRSTDLPSSAILCIVDIVDVMPATAIAHNLTDQEKAMGDFGWGRFAWRLKVVERFTTPKPMRGRQGLWSWET